MSDTVVFAREPFAALASPGSQPDAANAAVLKVVGELDLDGVPEVDHELRRAEARATLVVVDLRELEFIDTSSACLLLETHTAGSQRWRTNARRSRPRQGRVVPRSHRHRS